MSAGIGDLLFDWTSLMQQRLFGYSFFSIIFIVVCNELKLTNGTKEKRQFD
jgi:hypothetical protein